jgi:hypothetical protein
MLNLAGTEFDFGPVLFAVLEECEHQRRGFAAGEAGEKLMEIARRKLAEICDSYEECGGNVPAWAGLEREVLETSMPQYIPAAIEQTRLEASSYDVWRRGDPMARTAFALLGLALGGLIIAIPWIPIFEDAFAFLLALGGLLYPELRKTAFDYRHSRLLNKLIARAERYQYDSRIHYTTSAKLEEELETPLTSPTRAAKGEGEGKVLEHPAGRRERGR